MARQEPLTGELIDGICKVIADTNSCLSVTEIAKLLGDSIIPDIDSQNTKWKRLYNAFVS